MMDFADLFFCISDQGVDNKRLGCWAFITITGKHNVTTSILHFYCPCFSKSPRYTYLQKSIYMAEHRDNIPETNYS